MKRQHWRCRADATQAPIVAALRKCGAAVELIGLPFDALVGFGGRIWLVDFKSPGGKATKIQQEFALRWPLCYWSSVKEALTAIGVFT